MLSELDILVYLRSDHDLEQTAGRVFRALGSEARMETAEEWGGEHYVASGLGFSAVLYRNEDEMQDPEFEEYRYALEVQSRFWCVELDTVDLEGPLSEYYARELAFDLDLQTATEILLDTTEEAEIFELRAFKRNPSYRLDQSPTTPKVFVVETRRIEEPFEGEEWEDEDLAEDEEPAAGDDET